MLSELIEKLRDKFGFKQDENLSYAIPDKLPDRSVAKDIGSYEDYLRRRKTSD